MASGSAHRPPIRLVECPRCGLRLTARLHMLVSPEPQECPRCAMDAINVPMYFTVGQAPRAAEARP